MSNRPFLFCSHILNTAILFQIILCFVLSYRLTLDAWRAGQNLSSFPSIWTAVDSHAINRCPMAHRPNIPTKTTKLQPQPQPTNEKTKPTTPPTTKPKTMKPRTTNQAYNHTSKQPNSNQRNHETTKLKSTKPKSRTTKQ